MNHYCKECEREECEEKVCKCGACLYKNSKQDIEAALKHGYPIFICTRCGESHFWD
jgi:hypothetical protein